MGSTNLGPLLIGQIHGIVVAPRRQRKLLNGPLLATPHVLRQMPKVLFHLLKHVVIRNPVEERNNQRVRVFPYQFRRPVVLMVDIPRGDRSLVDNV